MASRCVRVPDYRIAHGVTRAVVKGATDSARQVRTRQDLAALGVVFGAGLVLAGVVYGVTYLATPCQPVFPRCACA
jgi:hypothetical protein